MAIAGDHAARLPGMKGDEEVQNYRGDFFEIRLSKNSLQDNSLDCWLDGHILDWHFIISFDPDDLKYIPGILSASHLNSLIPFFPISLENCLVRLFTCTIEGALADRYMYARIIDVLIELSHLACSKNDISFDEELIKKAEQVKLYIDEDMSTYPTVTQLAKKVWLSPSVLQQVFQYRYGTSVGKYSREVRMHAAHELLLTTNDLLLSIALAVGFNDTGNFCTSFKNFFGYTPGTLRKNKGVSQQ